jgi:hypothetical protein
MTDGGLNTLAARGLEELFFQLCCCVSFLVLGEIVFGVTFVLKLQNSCGVVLVFWFWREIVFGVTYILNYDTVVQLCQFFGCGRK